jgi:methionine transaminase
MAEGHNQYAPMPGLPSLRDAIAAKIERIYGTTVDPQTEITVTPGGTYAIYTAFTTILKEGDEVIVLEPCYDSYVPNIELNKARAILIPLKVPGYGVDWQAVEEAITPRTRAIIINTPHNPTGAVLQQEDLLMLERITKDTGIYIVSDEVYEHLIFDDISHQSILRYPALLQRSFVCFSFGKVYNCTGWKQGYCVAPAALMKEFRKVHQFNAFSCFTPTQVALASYLYKEEAYLRLAGELQAKRDYFKRIMAGTKFTLQPSYGSYFICGTYEKITDESDKTFAIRLTKEYGVATIPVSAFYQNGKDDKVLRFCFSKKEETLERAVERLMKL